MGTEAGVKLDTGKLQMRLIPNSTIIGLAEVLTFGAEKYTPNGWQTVANAEDRYMDALLRHLYAFKSGEAIDPESRLHHLKHVLVNASFLLHFEEEKTKQQQL